MNKITRHATQVALIFFAFRAFPVMAADVPFESISSLGAELYQQLVAWRRDFYIDESGLDIGVKAMSVMAWEYMISHPIRKQP